jgi:hypothetical protein
MKGSQEYLTTVVVKDAANWLTPQEDDSSNVNPKDTRRAGLVSQVNGLPAPANPSTDGSRQESWATPECKNHVGYQVDRTGAMWPRLGSQVAGKLNPRWVETLMGLPVGWVMPSCKSPVTIELTSCDFSETESCLPQPSELFAF